MVKLAAILLQQKNDQVSSRIKNGQVSSNFSAAKNGQVSSNFSAAEYSQVSSNFAAAKNGQVCSNITARSNLWHITQVKCVINTL